VRVVGRYQCYICMDSEETEDDALIAPCQCKGSTALVHVKCLQRLISSGDAHRVGHREPQEWVPVRFDPTWSALLQTNVISTKHESHTCKICKARYKTHVRLKDGTLVSLLNPTLLPPYLTLIVVTRHDSHPDLFNTIFQLSFSR
jgi:hypothetical protein